MVSKSALLACSLTACAGYNVTDDNGFGRRFDGIGAISGGGATSRLLFDYVEPQRSEILDFLFLPNFGASLQILKVEVGADVDSTNGVEASHMRSEDDLSFNRGYEWWLMTEAKKRNPDILTYALPWGWPAWIGQNTTNPWTNITKPLDYMLTFARGARDVYNVTLDYMGVWNEQSWSSDYIVSLRQALDAEGFGATQIVASDDGGWPIAPTVLKNTTLSKSLYALGSHYPGSESDAAAQQTGLQLWASEDNSKPSSDGGGSCWGRILSENYVRGLMTGTISWSLICSWYPRIEFWGDGLTVAVSPWSGNYRVDPPIWSSAHYTQFTKPGWRYLAHGSGVGYLTNGGTFTTLLAADASAFTLVAEKFNRKDSGCSWSGVKPNATTDETAVFTLGGTIAALAAKAGGVLQVWRSHFTGGTADPGAMFSHSTVEVVDGSVTVDISVGDLVTLTTLTTGNKGAHPAPPSPAPFPLPWSDSFDASPLEGPGKYWSDLNGGFEVAADPDPSHGRVLQQRVPAKPILWLRDDQRPHTVLGDAVSWVDMSMTIDFKLTAPGESAAFGLRCQPVGSQSQQTDILPGLWVVVDDSGVWNVTYSIGAVGNAAGVVATGRLPAAPAPGTWHTFSMALANATVAVATLDGAPVPGLSGLAFNATAIPSTGWVALGTAAYGHYTMFDNVAVRPTAA